jgi:hypothetical protein
VHWKVTALWDGEKVELRETQRAVTPFGGLVVFLGFLRQVGYREAVSKHLPFRLTSPNAIDPVETFTAFLLSVLAGARRLTHTSLLRADVALHALLGVARFPVDDTIRNLFKRYGHQQGALRGPNPRKHERPSHHSLIEPGNQPGCPGAIGVVLVAKLRE